MVLSRVRVMLRPSATQQKELDQLLAAQRNPASPEYRQWLTPTEFGRRFGISAADHSRIVAWLTGQGLPVAETGQGNNWIVFSGTAGAVGQALGTSMHRFDVNGETHFANASEPLVPEALAGIVSGITGLNDFVPKPQAAHIIPIGSDPDYNRGTSHYLVPQDYATIYNLAPLYAAGIDGTGQTIAVVGESDISLTDIRAFRTRYSLPANDPKLLLYSPTDPGFNGAEVEGDLDVEWAGALAPKATIYYVYGQDAFEAVTAAVNANLAQIITISYSGCENDISDADNYRAIWQQGNAQGITILNSSGDSGPACDLQGERPYATLGKTVGFPANLPETTGVGGTRFNEGNGTYWSANNSGSLGSALSYIPEVVWNESNASGLLASGGGPSTRYPKPDWQTGPGVPNDGARDVPDVAFSAAGHDAYYINYSGGVGAVFGTSASAPSFAGILALLNHYQVSKGFQKTPGLGNINPQLYRLAQSTPAVFHDITGGDNIVPCAQGSPDCLAGSYGYAAGPGYDLATGLGSVDGNSLLTSWNQSASPVVVSMSSNAATYGLNDVVKVTAEVVPASGSGAPTGRVDFIATGGVILGSVSLTARAGVQVADFIFPAWQLENTSTTLRAVYSGDATFSGGGASLRLHVNTPVGVSWVIPEVNPTTINASPADAQGPVWQTTVTLFEVNGVPAQLIGFAIDGQAQPLAQYFPATSIPAGSSLSATLSFRNIAAPVTQVFTFTGIDSSGQTWTRSVPVTFSTAYQRVLTFQMTAAPLTMARNPSASSACQWSQRLSIDETSGFQYRIYRLFAGAEEISARIPAIFGTDQLAAWGSVQGTLCWGNITPPANNDVFVELADDFGDVIAQDLIVSFAPPAVSPTALTVSPASVTITPPNAAPFGAATLTVNPGSAAQEWTASVFPANRTTAWLTLSKYSGTGTTSVALQTSAAGFEPGAYRATVVVQSAGTVPQVVATPVMFVVGGSGGTDISSVGNSLSSQPTASPGMIMSVYGTQLANSAQTAAAQPLPYSLGGVSATVNGIAAPFFYSAPGQLNIQIPYEAGAGPAVLGVNNNGEIAGYQFQIAPAGPAILADANGNLLPAGSAAPGTPVAIYLSGSGVVTPSLRTGYAPAATNVLSNLPAVRLPLTVTVGGIQAFLEFAGITPGVIGLAQVNFLVPASLAPGPQPVVVTINGVSSPPVNLTVKSGS